MQNKSYTITAMIDGWEFALAQDVPEEELEETLHRLTRRHELKNVGRYEVRPSETKKEGVGRSASDLRLRPSERSEARE
jgi:hypothetical protein